MRMGASRRWQRLSQPRAPPSLLTSLTSQTPHQPPAVRTLTGHRSSCLSISFHPFNDYVATGSLDTNLKVWDLRRRECIQTYKGHAKGITHVAISPDGRWVVSGCESGEVKVSSCAGPHRPGGVTCSGGSMRLRWRAPDPVSPSATRTPTPLTPP
jgi:WD40 repeat protein